jgi:hypothetical protein
MARSVRNGNVENVQDDYSFDLGFLFLFFFFSNNPFDPITTNERTNDICIHIAIFYSILFIHPTIPVGFSFLFLFFFRSLG